MPLLFPSGRLSDSPERSLAAGSNSHGSRPWGLAGSFATTGSTAASGRAARCMAEKSELKLKTLGWNDAPEKMASDPTAGLVVRWLRQHRPGNGEARPL